ncbi:MAG: glycosyl transferase, group 1 [Cyanobacteria bacterium RYN_339]|nr:glycosyl transferase, group 1 [Cyanobacteria bacterium RYN_339]
MRIGLIAPVALQVPPTGYGGTERVVSVLADGLVARGHEVTLFASGDSCTRARLHALYPHALTHLTEKAAYQPYETAHVAEAMRLARHFDVLHDHTKVTGVLEARFCPTPVITTVHNDFTTERRMVYGAYPGHRYVAISQAHARRMPELNFVGTVYNGLDLGETVFRAEKDDYLLFLGRLDAAKGAGIAARLAAELDLPLIMAGRKEPGYFDREIAPYMDGKRRRFIGEVSGRPKWELYAGARALIFPIQWEEPFGLVMIEALACGTPVLATRRGSVPEILTPETGVIVPDGDFAALAAGLEGVLRLDPRACRRRVEEHFSAARMVEAYEAVYAREAAAPGLAA